MKGNYQTQRGPQLRVLSEDQIEELHLATLEILRRTGVDVLDEEARELLNKAGADVDGNRVRIPAHLVEWAIQAAPPRVVLCDRDGHPAMFLEDSRCYYGTGSDTHNVVDPYTGERRPVVKADIVNVMKVCDYLPNIDFVMCMGIAHDVTESISDLHHFEAMVSHTKKPIVFTTWGLDNLKDLVEMAEVVVGSPEALRRNPFIALYAEPVSPLQHIREGTQALLYMAGKGLPVVYTPGLMAGAAGPVTCAGALAQGNAELLSGLVIAQLKREGTPFIYGGGIVFMDMATAVVAYVSPEFLLATAALNDLAHYYRLPMFSFAGCSDSKVFDQQATLEGALWTLSATLSGANLIHDVGYIESGLTTSFEMLVVSDEVISWVKRFMQGVEINEETLALDVIDQVGPGEHFLGEDHTLRHFKENWYPKLFDRGNYDSWMEEGKKTLGQRANEKVREILEAHVPEPLPGETQRRIAAIIERAEKRVREQTK